MSDEIKEILEHIKNYPERAFVLSQKEKLLLLDYITNLQTIEQQYGAILSENAELENKITNLQEENERLNKELMNKFETQQIMRDATGREYELILTRRVNLGKMYEDYKSRCEKAVEIAYACAQIDGGHHKMWIIDQMLRALLDTKYDEFIKEYEEDGEYKWDTGIAP